MQKVPALFKVRAKQDEKNIDGTSSTQVRRKSKICALCSPKKNQDRLYTIVDYDKVDKQTYV